jgi:hypothetical protein
VLSLPTPPKCFAASVLATLHAAFARKVRARPSECSTFEAISEALKPREGSSAIMIETVRHYAELPAGCRVRISLSS